MDRLCYNRRASLKLVYEKNYDDIGITYNYVVLCSYTKTRVFALNAKKTKHNIYLVKDLVQINGFNTPFSELMTLDCMLVPLHCFEHDDYIINESFFSVSDFASYLEVLRNNKYPHWNLFIFADYYLEKYKFLWSNEMIRSLGRHLGTLPDEGLVRQSFLDTTSTRNEGTTTYIDMRFGSLIQSLNIFDKSQIFSTVMFSGDPETLFVNTPTEFRNETIIYMDELTHNWNVKHFPTQQTLKWFSTINVTMVTLSSFNGIETRTQFNRYITMTSSGKCGLDSPVLGITNREDTVFFECEIPQLTYKIFMFQYIGYRVMVLDSDTIACELQSIEWDNSTYENVLRLYFATTHIQRRWRKCINDPNYFVCKKRLLNEFHILKSQDIFL